MRLFIFIKWLIYKVEHPFDRLAVLFSLCWILPCAISGIWIGPVLALQLISFGFVSLFFGIFLRVAYSHIKKLYSEFDDEQPPEDVAIIRKLKGIPTPSRSESFEWDGHP